MSANTVTFTTRKLYRVFSWPTLVGIINEVGTKYDKILVNTKGHLETGKVEYPDLVKDNEGRWSIYCHCNACNCYNNYEEYVIDPEKISTAVTSHPKFAKVVELHEFASTREEGSRAPNSVTTSLTDDAINVTARDMCTTILREDGKIVVTIDCAERLPVTKAIEPAPSAHVNVPQCIAIPDAAVPSVPTYKVVFIGPAKSGKSATVAKLLEREYKGYSPTLGVEVHPYRLGYCCFNIWDCAGDERFGGLRDGYYIGADCAIIFGDISAKIVEVIRAAPKATIYVTNVPDLDLRAEQVKRFLADLPITSKK